MRHISREPACALQKIGAALAFMRKLDRGCLGFLQHGPLQHNQHGAEDNRIGMAKVTEVHCTIDKHFFRHSKSNRKQASSFMENSCAV